MRVRRTRAKAISAATKNAFNPISSGIRSKLKIADHASRNPMLFSLSSYFKQVTKRSFEQTSCILDSGRRPQKPTRQIRCEGLSEFASWLLLCGSSISKVGCGGMSAKDRTNPTIMGCFKFSKEATDWGSTYLIGETNLVELICARRVLLAISRSVNDAAF
jgi:hypothetical protein